MPWSRAHSARTSSGPAMQVIQLTSVPPPTPEPGEHRDRAVPGREQAVVEVQAVVRVELVASAARLVDERPRLEDDDGSAGPRQLRGDHAAAGTRPDDDDVGLEHDRPVAVPAVACGGESSGRIGVGLRRRPAAVRHVADRGVERVRRPAARVGVGEEGQELAEGLERRPAQRRAASSPSRAGTRSRSAGVRSRNGDRRARSGAGWRAATRAGGGRAGAGGPGPGRPPAQRPRRRASRAGRRRPGTNVSASSARVASSAADQPAAGRRSSAGRRRARSTGGPGSADAPATGAPSPGPATARSGAAGPRDSRARSRPG